ncbi:MAG TPA: hypothetical protein VMR97_11850, partial [Acidimicrobiales bacterium]|nr:hypothetical protein [Acidimicrobiales bacterium]
TEIWDWQIDMTGVLQPGEAVSTPTSTLTDLPSTAIALADAPVVSGNSVIQRVQGSALEVGHSYLLVVTFIPAAGLKTSTVTLITVPV